MASEPMSPDDVVAAAAPFSERMAELIEYVNQMLVRMRRAGAWSTWVCVDNMSQPEREFVRRMYEPSGWRIEFYAGHRNDDYFVFSKVDKA